ncbi:MAG: 5'-nucleotidase C-terminal domain-containing protein [Firmicutes bacterium]|nr:5'-nucleotidase C-terminal domain-containing protein [Bacillota bacterium]
MKKNLSFIMILAMLITCFGPLSFAEETTAAAKLVPATTVEEKAIVSNTIDIVSFNDFHGNLAEDAREKGKNVGMAKMIGVINEYMAKNPNTIVVSGGDNYQGSAMSNLTQGAPVNNMFKAMDLKVSAVGNHEFDWGTSYMNKWQEDGGFQYLAANIVDEATGEVVAWAKPYSFTEVDGKKIAFIGLATTTTPTVTKADNVEGLKFVDAAEAAAKWVAFLKEGKAEEGTPDLIIAVTHLPSKQDKYGSDVTLPVVGEEINAVAMVDGIDGIISGHSHKTVAGYINNVPVVQAYKYGRAMAKISFEMNEDGSVKAATPSIDTLYKRKGDIIADATGTAEYDKWDKELGPIMGEKIGVATGTFSHNTDVDQTTPLGEFVCKLMAEKAGVDIAIQNGGGLRRDMPAGDITMGLMYEIMPFDNTLMVVELTGADLKKNIDNGLKPEGSRAGSFSGLEVSYDLNKPAGERILSMTLADGTPVEMDKVYKVVSNDFLVETTGADGYDFSTAKSKVNLMIPIRDAMVDEIKAKGSVTPANNEYEVNKTGKVVAMADYYVVKKGDVLWKIAKKYDIDYKKLGEMNNLKNNNVIVVGQKLKIAK